MTRWHAIAVVLGAVLGPLAPGRPPLAADPPAASAAAIALRERFVALRSAPGPNPFGMPLYLLATESETRVQGDVYALLDRHFAEIRPALEGVEQWCRILTLHLNIKYCRLADPPGRNALTVGVAAKNVQSLGSVHWARFSFASEGSGTDHLHVVLRAPSGPFGTSDYRLAVEVVPFEGRSLLHVSYAYSYGVVAGMAMQTYLATAGRNKVGFSVVGRTADGQPVHVNGMRGVIERNVIRYFFAIDAYLGAQRRPPPDRLLKSLHDWFDATERHPRQLREIGRNEYLDMKLREFERQQAAVAQ